MADKQRNHGRQERENYQRQDGQTPDNASPRDAEGNKIAQLGVATASTSDPDANWRDEAGSRPDQTISLQTSQASDGAATVPSAAPSGGTPRRGDDVAGKQRDRRCDARQSGADNETKPSAKAEEPDSQCLVSKQWVAERWQRWLFTGAFSLVCGFAGAWAYMHLSGNSKSNQQGGESSKADKPSMTAGDTKGGAQSNGQSAAGQGSSNQGGASGSKTAGLHSTESTDNLTKDAWVDANLEHLAHRIDVLGKRLSKMTIPEQESPAVLHALQMQVADLENDFEQVATLPGKLRQLERDLSALKEDVSALKQPSLGETDSERRSTALHSSTLESGGEGEPTTQTGDSPRGGDTP